MPANARFVIALAVALLAAVPPVQAYNLTFDDLLVGPVDPSSSYGPYIDDHGAEPYTWETIDCEVEPWVATSVELLWLDRSTAGARNVVFAEIAGARVPLVDAGDLLFVVEAGVRVRSVLGEPTGERLELVYAGIYDQTARESATLDPAAVPGLTRMAYPMFGTTQDGAFSYTAAYRSSLHSLEANWGLSSWWRVRPLVGIRCIRQEEVLDIFETNTPHTGSTLRSRNDLLGAQLGAEVGLWDRSRWFRVEAGLKAGVYYDFLHIRGDVHNAGVRLQTLHRDFRNGACAGEINVTGIWQVSSCFSVRLGYTGLWLAEIGLAPDQINRFDFATGLGSPNLDGVSYQGGHFGLEYIW
jgi:hypothetical protein